MDDHIYNRPQEEEIAFSVGANMSIENEEFHTPNASMEVEVDTSNMCNTKKKTIKNMKK